MTRTSPLSPATLDYLSTARDVPTLAYVAVEFAAYMSKWTTRRQTRRALQQLENWQLDDVGLTSLEAYHEGSKAFWQA